MNTLHEIGAEGLREAVKVARRWNRWHITLDTFAKACGMPKDSRRRIKLDRLLRHRDASSELFRNCHGSYPNPAR